MKSSFPPEELDSIEQQLFESLAGDSPPKRAHRAVAVALGLSATLTTATITGATAGAAVASTGANAGAAGAGAGVSGVAAKAGFAMKASTLLLVKWVGVGTLAGAVSVGAVGYAHRTWQNALHPGVTLSTDAKGSSIGATGRAPTVNAPAPMAEPMAVGPAAQIAEPAPIAEHAPPMAPRVTVGRTAALASAPASRGSVAKEPTAKEPATKEPVREPIDDTSNLRAHPASMLAAEVAALDDVRRAIADRDGERALGLLRRHARDFPSATLNIEATVLRIESLLLAGSTQAARDLGRDFLASHPTSTHAARVRHLLAEQEKP